MGEGENLKKQEIQDNVSQENDKYQKAFIVLARTL